MVALNAWMNGEFVGVWQVNRGAHSFSYTPSWLKSEKSRPLSLSLPLTRTLEIQGEVVANYFDNLLPDNVRIRERISHLRQSASTDRGALRSGMDGGRKTDHPASPGRSLPGARHAPRA